MTPSRSVSQVPAAPAIPRARAVPFVPSRTLSLVIIGACMLIPLVLAYFFLNESLRLDESQSLWQTSRTVGAILIVVAGDVHVPLYHILLHFWRLILGDSITTARLLSLFFFELSIPAIYLLGAKAYDRRVGLLAAVLFSISPFMNWYASEIRMYTMFVFFTILNQYFFVRLFKDRSPSDHVWALYAVTAVLGIYTHYFFALNLVGQALFYFMRRPLFPPYALRRLILTAVLVVVAITPWVWYVYSLGNAGFQEPTLVPPTFVDFFNAFSQFLFGFQTDAINTVFLSLWPVVVILGIFTLGKNQRLSRETEYFASTVVISFVLAFLVSILVAPLFVSRYLSFALPAFYLVLSTMVLAYTPRTRLVAGTILVMLMLATLAIEIKSPYTPVKENYAQAVDYLTAHATAQDAIIVSVPFTLYPVQYYYRGPAPISTLPYWDQYAHGGIPDFNAADLPNQIAQETNGNQNVFLLLSYNEGYEAQIKEYFQGHYQLLHEQTFSNDLTLYVYRLRYNTPNSAILTSLSNTSAQNTKRE